MKIVRRKLLKLFGPTNEYSSSVLLILCHESEAKHFFNIFSSGCLKGNAPGKLCKITVVRSRYSNFFASLMASYSQLINLCLLFQLLFITSFSSISCNKVSVGFYYESLCPYCANFTIGDLAKIFCNGLIDIVDLDLVPWGNAKLQGDNTFICQVLNLFFLLPLFLMGL